MPVFLAEREQLLTGERVRLSGAEARHGATVQRLAPGERVDVTDGAGLVVEGVVTAARRDELEIAVHQRRKQPPPQPRLVAVQALAKGGRDEQAVEAMTEAGADVIVPWAAERCVARWPAGRESKGFVRWAAKAREAGKQSRRAFLPEISGLATTAAVADRLAGAEMSVILDGGAEARLAELSPPASGEVVVVIGPEGGVSPGELTAFRSAGAVAARLGSTVLRTSTAGVAACAVLLSRCGRW